MSSSSVGEVAGDDAKKFRELSAKLPEEYFMAPAKSNDMKMDGRIMNAPAHR